MQSLRSLIQVCSRPHGNSMASLIKMCLGVRDPALREVCLYFCHLVRLDRVTSNVRQRHPTEPSETYCHKNNQELCLLMLNRSELLIVDKSCCLRSDIKRGVRHLAPFLELQLGQEKKPDWTNRNSFATTARSSSSSFAVHWYPKPQPAHRLQPWRKSRCRRQRFLPEANVLL